MSLICDRSAALAGPGDRADIACPAFVRSAVSSSSGACARQAGRLVRAGDDDHRRGGEQFAGHALGDLIRRSGQHRRRGREPVSMSGEAAEDRLARPVLSRSGAHYHAAGDQDG
jgi:hypothetical protein